MHGRVKVRTSEEEKARKEKERQEKLKSFKHAMQIIQNKRKLGELDVELLGVTGKVLSSNPDIYTLWNIRREILLILRKTIEDKSEVSKLHDDELQLTEYCLKVNPKSYCAWHQREWVLVTRSDPDWKGELQLCNMYLRLDERNFHTWDYRRFVVSHYASPLEDEFNFTTEKLLDNFSNYSAWHYRSKMLLQLYPDLEGGRPIEDSHHKHELKLILDAAFTDPDDTSAWFYQRWLLGAVKSNTQLAVVTVTLNKIIVAYSLHVSKEYVEHSTTIQINGDMVKGDWVSCTRYQYDNLWVMKNELKSLDHLDVKVKYKNEDKKQVITCQKYSGNSYVGANSISFQKQYSAPVIEELNKQLVACRQLLELEPDNRWTLLTLTVFLYCIDARKYHTEVLENLKRLKILDRLRSGYYNDLITKWSIEEHIYKDYKNLNTRMKISFDSIIASLPHLQYYSYCEEVDLSDQSLTSTVLPSLVVLQNCKKLNISNNKLSSLKGFPVLELEELNLKGNDQLEKDELKSFIEKCKFNVLL